MWRQSDVQLDSNYLSLATGTQQAPRKKDSRNTYAFLEGVYAIAGTANGTTPKTAVWMSHVIECQQGNGDLHFKYNMG